MTRRITGPTGQGRLVRSARRFPALRSEQLEPGMRIGLFGGSFDPPHAGHMHVAMTAMKRLRLDRVWWLVSPGNPLKSRTPGALNQRLDAVERLAGSPRMVITDLEARWGVRRTADLVSRLVNQHPGVNFVWIMGSDNLAGFHHWHQWRAIFDALPVAIVARPHDPVRARLAPAARLYAHSRHRENDASALPLTPAPAWTYLTEPLQSVSSTALRARNSN